MKCAQELKSRTARPYPLLTLSAPMLPHLGLTRFSHYPLPCYLTEFLFIMLAARLATCSNYVVSVEKTLDSLREPSLLGAWFMYAYRVYVYGYVVKNL